MDRRPSDGDDDLFYFLPDGIADDTPRKSGPPGLTSNFNAAASRFISTSESSSLRSGQVHVDNYHHEIHDRPHSSSQSSFGMLGPDTAAPSTGATVGLMRHQRGLNATQDEVYIPHSAQTQEQRQHQLALQQQQHMFQEQYQRMQQYQQTLRPTGSGSILQADSSSETAAREWKPSPRTEHLDMLISGAESKLDGSELGSTQSSPNSLSVAPNALMGITTTPPKSSQSMFASPSVNSFVSTPTSSSPSELRNCGFEGLPPPPQLHRRSIPPVSPSLNAVRSASVSLGSAAAAGAGVGFPRAAGAATGGAGGARLGSIGGGGTGTSTVSTGSVAGSSVGVTAGVMGFGVTKGTGTVHAAPAPASVPTAPAAALSGKANRPVCRHWPRCNRAPGDCKFHHPDTPIAPKGSGGGGVVSGSGKKPGGATSTKTSSGVVQPGARVGSKARVGSGFSPPTSGSGRAKPLPQQQQQPTQVQAAQAQTPTSVVTSGATKTSPRKESMPAVSGVATGATAAVTPPSQGHAKAVTGSTRLEPARGSGSVDSLVSAGVPDVVGSGKGKKGEKEKEKEKEKETSHGVAGVVARETERARRRAEAKEKRKREEEARKLRERQKAEEEEAEAAAARAEARARKEARELERQREREKEREREKAKMKARERELREKEEAAKEQAKRIEKVTATAGKNRAVRSSGGGGGRYEGDSTSTSSLEGDSGKDGGSGGGGGGTPKSRSKTQQSTKSRASTMTTPSGRKHSIQQQQQQARGGRAKSALEPRSPAPTPAVAAGHGKKEQQQGGGGETVDTGATATSLARPSSLTDKIMSLLLSPRGWLKAAGPTNILTVCLTHLMSLFVILISLLLALVLTAGVAVVRLHAFALAPLTDNFQVALCYMFTSAFPVVVRQIPWAPPWGPICLWYAFLVQMFATTGPLPVMVFFRVILPLLFLAEGVSHHCFLLDLNHGDLLLISFILASIKVSCYTSPIFLLAVAVQIVVSVGWGAVVPAQWFLLVHGLCSLRFMLYVRGLLSGDQAEANVVYHHTTAPPSGGLLRLMGRAGMRRVGAGGRGGGVGSVSGNGSEGGAVDQTLRWLGRWLGMVDPGLGVADILGLRLSSGKGVRGGAGVGARPGVLGGSRGKGVRPSPASSAIARCKVPNCPCGGRGGDLCAHGETEVGTEQQGGGNGMTGRRGMRMRGKKIR